MKIYLYEIKKIWSKRSFKAVLLILFVYLFAMMFFAIKDHASYVNSDGSKTYGLKAIEQMKNDKMKYNGVVTEDVIKQIIKENSQINSTKEFQTNEEGYVGLNDKGYSKTQGFQDIRDLINSSFCGFGEYNYYKVDSLRNNDAKLFYSNRIDSIKSWVNDNDFNTIEKNYIINSAKKLKTPFRYSYMDGWNVLFEFLSVILYSVSIVVCILSAQIFGIEYQNDAGDIFLSSKNGKNKAISLKILAGLTISSILYWSIVLIFPTIILSIFGFDGGNCMIESGWSLWKSFYNVTNFQGVLMVVLLGYIGCLFMSSFTMFLSIKMKSAFGAIIVSFLTIMAPAVFAETVKNPFFAKLLEVLPHQMFMGYTTLRSYSIFSIGNKVLTPYEFLPMIYILLSIVVLCISYKSFKKQQTN